MNMMLQRHCAKHIYIVPEGLRELMTDISREVLRHHPENIYLFVADYLDALMITRENARVAARLVQNITEIAITTCEFLKNTGMSREEIDSVIGIMEDTFKRGIQEPQLDQDEPQTDEIEEANVVSNIIHDANIPPQFGEEAAVIIQHAYRAFKIRNKKEKELLLGIIDWRVAARSAIRLYRKTGVTHEEANRAATLIKAAYKGYYSRRVMRKILQESIELEKAKELLSIEQSLVSKSKEEVKEEVQEKEPIVQLKSEKGVKIDYGSVVPHVDFGDSKVIEDKSLGRPSDITHDKSAEKTAGGSTTSVIATHALDTIIDAAFKQLEKKLEFIEDYADLDNLDEEQLPIVIKSLSAIDESIEQETEIQKVDLNDDKPHVEESLYESTEAPTETEQSEANENDG